MGQVTNRSGNDVAAPAVFQRHGDAQRNAEIAGLASLGQSAKLADLDIDHVHRKVGTAAHQDVEAVDGFIHDEWMVGTPPNGQAFFVTVARLFDVNIQVADGSDNACRFVH